MQERKKNIGALNLLKFGLAFLTFLFHWNIHFGIVYHNKILNHFINAGAFCMTGFFILSGFLLYYIYGNRNFCDKETLKQFYIKRLIKLMPLYYIVVFLYALITLIVNYSATNWILQLMTIIPIQAFFPNLFAEYLNGGLWFVSVLIVLYFLFPIMCILLQDSDKNKRNSLIRLIVLFFIMYFFSLFPQIVKCYYPMEQYWFMYYVSPVFRLPEFIVGMLCAKFFFNYNIPKLSNILYSIIVMIMLILSVGLLYSNNFFYHVRFRNNYNFYNCVTVILFPMLIYYLSTSKGYIYEKITQNKISDYLGKIAYSFFLGQFFVIFIVIKYFKPNNYFGMNGLSILIVSFIINMVTAILLYEFAEKRISDFLMKKIYKKQ